MIAMVVVVLGIAAALVQLGYWGYFFSRIHRLNSTDKAAATHRVSIPMHAQLPVSVLICAKNEADNLTKYLPAVLEQHYHDEAGARNFEVIVVNDQSTDDTEAILTAFALQHPHLKAINIPLNEVRSLPGKKFALSKAIAAAAHDYLLMTDADCQPASKAWITWMAFPFIKGKEIVAGYGGYFKSSGLLNRFIRCETLHTYLQYLTYNLAGIPYMAVGRNLACKKELLLNAQAHPLWQATASGDDDLLITFCATPGNMTVNTHPASYTFSEARPTLSTYIKQKQRHFSTGKLYSRKVQLLLGGYAFSHALLWGCLLLSCFGEATAFAQLLFGLMLTGRAMYYTTWSVLSDTMDSRKLKFFWPLFDIGWLFYNAIFAPFIFWKNKQQWK